MQACHQPYLEPSASTELSCCPWGLHSTGCISAGVLDETERFGLFILVSISFANKWLLPDACFKWWKIILKILKHKEGRGSSWCLRKPAWQAGWAADGIRFRYTSLAQRKNLLQRGIQPCLWASWYLSLKSRRSRNKQHPVPSTEPPGRSHGLGRSAAAGTKRGVRGESCFTPNWDLKHALRGTYVQISLFIYFPENISLILFFKMHSLLSISESEKQGPGVIHSCNSNLGTKGRSLCLFPVVLTYIILVCPTPGTPMSF